MSAIVTLLALGIVIVEFTVGVPEPEIAKGTFVDATLLQDCCPVVNL